MYKSTKYFDGYSVAIRQHKAEHSHCKLLHGYAFEFRIVFISTEPEIEKQLDDMNWIVDFGGFKSKPSGNGLKDWLTYMFDHTLLIERDDPYLELFEQLSIERLCDLRILDIMGAEGIAKLVFDKFNEVLSKTDAGRCRVESVEIFENKKNSGIYEER